jgi:phosphohistidine phosphatase
MRQLLLVRHGEAEPAPHGGSDAERALTANGRADVQAAADAIAQARLNIERVLVSTARRTLETAAILDDQLHFIRPPEQQDKLYLASPSGILQLLEHCPASCRTVVVIGHNPGLSELIERLTSGDQTIGLRTAGVCLLTFASDGWRDFAADIAASCELLR